MDKIPEAYSVAKDGVDHNATKRGNGGKTAEVCRLNVDARGASLKKVVKKGPLGMTSRTTMEAFLDQVRRVGVVWGYHPCFEVIREVDCFIR